MPEGLTRFETQLSKIKQIISSLPPGEEKALPLYKSPARQWLFYVESLTHIYKQIHNKKKFERIRLATKLIEDQLGQMDYYDAFIKEFSVQENFPTAVLNHLRKNFTSAQHVLEGMLTKEGWTDPKMSALQTIEKDLEDADWLTGEAERKIIGETLIHEIDLIKEDYASGKLNFDNIENGVHEFRRRVRWISIYAQALDGLIQIRHVDAPDPDLKAYLTKEVLESPFNVLPSVKPGIKSIYIEAPNFYALSWMIAESGKLKDEGLRIICVETALRETHYVSEKEVKPTTKILAVKSLHSPKEIKAIMKLIGDSFIYQHKVLDRIKHDIRKSIGE